MTPEQSKAVETARAYYNSTDADAFYSTVWGEEDIHIGMYRSPEDDIRTANRRTITEMAARVRDLLEQDARVLDLGSGYGGTARHLAREHAVNVVALNVSEVENERARQLTRAQGLADRVDVVDGNFEDVPYPSGTFDVVWSQDAILHAGDRARVVAEAARVLRPGGALVFTDPLRADDAPATALVPILERLNLETLGSPASYRDAAERAGLDFVAFHEHREDLVRQYADVLQRMDALADALAERVSDAYLARMRKGLKHWVDGGRNGHLTWGILHFRKPRDGDAA